MSRNYETVQPFAGDWTVIPPTDDLIESVNTGRHAFINDGFKSRCILAIARAGEQFFTGDPDSGILTILDTDVNVPKPGAENEGWTQWNTLRQSLREIGFRLMKYGCEIGQVETAYPGIVTRQELGSPGDAFEHTTLSTKDRLKQEAYPHGLGYATLVRAVQLDSFHLGWCDPSDGRRREVPVDVTAVRGRYPNLQPVLRESSQAGGF